MKSSKNHIDLFDNFISDKLSKKELSSFKERLNSDSEFRREFNQYNSSLALIKSIKLSEEMGYIIDTRANKSFTLKKYLQLGIAASILIAATIGYFTLGTRTNKPQFYTYFEPYPNILATRNDAIYIKAMNHYVKNEFNEAIDLFSEIEYQNDTTYFYLAISHLALKEPNQSIYYFELISDNSLFRQQVNWYKGLSYCMIDNRSKCYEQFRSIVVGEYGYSNAKKILNKLD